MVRRKLNRKLSASDKKALERYKKWHWGIPAGHVWEWKDKDYPRQMIEVGRLAELHVKRPKDKKFVINVAKKYIHDNHVAFDPNHRSQRLYILSGKDIRANAKKRFWKKGAETWPLSSLAVTVGHRHATSDYPNIRVQPIGKLTHITYLTAKKGDGLSFYIHKMGEEGGVQPWLAVDSKGRFWIAGGSYTSPIPGITN